MSFNGLRHKERREIPKHTTEKQVSGRCGQPESRGRLMPLDQHVAAFALYDSRTGQEQLKASRDESLVLPIQLMG